MKKAIIIFICFCLCALVIYFYTSKIPPKMPVNLLIAPNLPQDSFAFTPKNLPLKKPLLSIAQQTAFHKAFLKRYYYPWSASDTPTQYCLTADGQNCKSVLTFENEMITVFLKDLGYNNDYQANTKSWMDAIVANMQLNTFPNVNCNTSDMCHGITVENTNIRIIPTMNPSYAKITEPGEAYPFDYIQESNLWLGTPVMIVQQSKDHEWLLIKGPGLLGWVPTKSIAFVSKDFIKEWQNHAMVTPILLKFTINPNLKLTTPKIIYLGSLLPYIKHTANSFLTLLPVTDANQQAKTISYNLSNYLVTRWPLIPTPQNFNLLINQLLGMTYGWGGIGFDTDCSGTIQRLFGTFGIWLPRDSKNQLDFGGYIYPLPLSTYPVAVRQAMFTGSSNAQLPSLKPYLTLIGFGDEKNGIGHVALYLGKYPQNSPKQIVIFQSVWGDKIMQGHMPIGRAIIGKAAITTMGFGTNLDLPNTGYSTDTLWQKPGIYVTDLTKPQNTIWLKQQNS